MSYEKVTGTPNTVLFYYVIDQIFNLVHQQTSFKAVSTTKPDGQADFERVELSVDEKSYMKRMMKEAMLDIFSVLFKIINADSTISHDLTYTPSGGSAANSSYASIVDNAHYREINLALIDQKIENAIVCFILFKWYAMKGIPDAEIFAKEYQGYLAEISQKSIALRQVV